MDACADDQMEAARALKTPLPRFALNTLTRFPASSLTQTCAAVDAPSIHAASFSGDDFLNKVARADSGWVLFCYRSCHHR